MSLGHYVVPENEVLKDSWVCVKKDKKDNRGNSL